MFSVRRSSKNPILGPISAHSWEAHSAFNGCPIVEGSKTHLLYRAMSAPEQFGNDHFSLSTIGKAVFNKKGDLIEREEFISPEESWERYGCEDPRVTKVGSTYYTFYTALSGYPFSAQGIRVAVALSKTMDKGSASIREKHLVTPFNSKAMVLFPEKIDGKFTAILTVNPDRPPSTVALAQFEEESDMWSDEYWNEWYENRDSFTLQIPRYQNDHVEVGAAPVKTPYGWLVIYSHIQRYYSNEKVFGIEAVLLDLKNPFRVLAKTIGPLIVPEEQYEKQGIVSDIVFPMGATLRGKTLSIYYGGADTVCAEASVDIDGLIGSMLFSGGTLLPEGKSSALAFFKTHKRSYGLSRPFKTPILLPRESSSLANPYGNWESQAVFNPAAIYLGGKVHILYRAMSDDNTSVIGYASSKNGSHIDERLDVPVYVPRESFEDKGVPHGNSGCEDPRLTKVGDRIYMCYTAFNGIRPPASALTSISEKDFLAKNWNWSEPTLITADGVDDKDSCILSEKIHDKFVLLHRVNNCICVDMSEDMNFSNRNSFNDAVVLKPRPGMWDSKKVGLAAPPISTPFGWLMIYHGVSDSSSTYRAGAALLDKKDLRTVIGRTTDFILDPRESYEKEGTVRNVVFPCGAVVIKDVLHIYYGGADKVVGVATMPLMDLLNVLKG